MFLLRHPVVEVVFPFFEVEVTYPPELLLDGNQFVHKCVILVHLLVEYLHLFRDIVRTATI
jgi:hypothetical protein